jgi:coenzyme F420-reducing hydrogenase gamma subunit
MNEKRAAADWTREEVTAPAGIAISQRRCCLTAVAPVAPTAPVYLATGHCASMGNVAGLAASDRGAKHLWAIVR